MLWNTKTKLRAALVALIPVLFASCTPAPPTRPNEIALWEEAVFGAKDVRAQQRRTPAQAAGPRCLADRLSSVPALRADIAAVERERTGKAIAGIWKHLDLSQLPRPQAEFLSRFGDTLPTSIDYAACTELTCVMQKVYGDDETSGLLAYWWFLRMGYVLGNDTKIPGVAAVPGLGYEKYLFKPIELRGFWRVSQLLPASYRYLSAVNEGIHRLPDGYQIPGSPGACGIRMGSSKDGSIILMDTCLKSHPDEKPGYSDIDYDKDMHHNIAHELSHALDAASTRESNWLSQQPEWRALSRWTVQESIMSVDEYCTLMQKKATDKCETVGTPAVPEASCAAKATSDREGCVALAGNITKYLYREWSYDHANAKFASIYGKVSPLEDFAEAVPFARIAGDQADAKIPEKVAFISKNVFGGRNYDSASVVQQFAKAVYERVSAQLPGMIDKCFAQPSFRSSSIRTDAEEALSFGGAVSAEVTACIRSGYAAAVAFELDEIRRTEFEGCAILDASESLVKQQALVPATTELQALVSKNESVAAQMRELFSFREQLSETLDIRKAYLDCYESPKVENCYQAVIANEFDALSQTLTQVSPEALATERVKFLAEHGVLEARNALLDVFTHLFAGIEAKLERAADRRWRECFVSAQPTELDQVALLTEPFTGGERFVSAPLLNCLNRAAKIEVDDIQNRFTASLGFAISSPSAQSFVRAMLMPHYVAQLTVHADEAFAAEEKIREVAQKNFFEARFADLTTHLEWLGSPPAFGDESRVACEKSAFQAFDFISDAISSVTHFASIEDLRIQWTQALCSAVLKNPTVIKAVAHAKSAAFATAMTALDDAVAAQAESLIDGCIKKFAYIGPINRKNRAACLRTRMPWLEVENSAKQAWLESVESQSFRDMKGEVDRSLSTHRKVTQGRVIDAMEKQMIDSKSPATNK